MVKRCNYASPEVEERLVRDHFVVGLLDRDLSDKLCRSRSSPCKRHLRMSVNTKTQKTSAGHATRPTRYRLPSTPPRVFVAQKERPGPRIGPTREAAFSADFFARLCRLSGSTSNLQFLQQERAFRIGLHEENKMQLQAQSVVSKLR